MKARDACLQWTPPGCADYSTAGQVRVCRHARLDDGPDYLMWMPVVPMAPPKSGALDAITWTFIHFHTLVVRDGIPPAVAHEAFLNIAEYRQRISPDIDGATDIPKSRENSRPEK